MSQNNETKSSPAARSFLESITMMFTGRTLEDVITNGCCPICTGPTEDREVSLKPCAKCQEQFNEVNGGDGGQG